jgi:hypothetical protein
MKNIYWISFLLLGLPTNAAEGALADSATPFSVVCDKHCFFVDGNGRTALPGPFLLARPFSEGAAYVETAKQRGFINRNGQYVHVLKDELRVVAPLREGAALVTRDIRTGTLIPFEYNFIDLNGELVSGEWYRMAHPFSEGLAWVISQDGTSSYLRRNGSTLATPRRAVAQASFSNGFALVRSLESYQYGFIDANGVVAIPFQYSRAAPFSEGLAAVMNQYERWGFVDKSGRTVIDFQYDSVGRFSEGVASVYLRGECGYIDTKGKVVIPIAFQSCAQFSESVAAVASVGGYGYINRRGAWVIRPQFRRAAAFESSGLSEVRKVTRQGRCIEGLINKRGRFVWSGECFPAAQ